MTETEPARPRDPVTRGVLDHEIELVRQAIALVSSGGAPRVTVAGIHFGDTIVEPARAWAAKAGVRLTPLWRADESGLDIAIDRAPDEEGTR